VIPDAHLLLVRHAEPTDRDRCHGARSDPGLSPLGHRQATALGLRVRLLAGEFGPVRRLICSPAARAITTAVPLAAHLGRQHSTDERWRERDFGEWEGQPWHQLWPTVPREVTDDADAYLAWTPPGGETPQEVVARIAPALQDALEGSGTTVVVTHAGAIRQALSAALDLPWAATLQVAVPYARITGLARTDDAVTLTRVGA